MNENKKIKIIIADDHPIFRKGLRKIIEADNEIEILGEAENGESALNKILDLKPDIALLDIDMPKLTGIQVLKELKKRKVNIKTIFLTVYSDESIFDEAMNLGILGYVLKDSAISDIINCIKSVADEKYYITPSLSDFLINLKNKLKRMEENKPALSRLTKTEMNVLSLLAEGKTSRQIGEKMFISHKTVDNHKANISDKLELRGMHILIKFAIENKAILQ